MSILCDTLHDLDVRFRAVVSIVNDWKEAANEQTEDGESQPIGNPSSVQTVWNIGEISKYLVAAMEGSRRILAICASTSLKKVVDDGESDQMRAALEVYLRTTRRLIDSLSKFIAFLDRLAIQEAKVADTSSVLQKVLEELAESIKRVEQTLELLEWEELNRQALSPAEFKQLAAYLLQTGKASA